HGTTTHGSQIQTPELQKTITAYYDAEGPVGDIFEIFPSENVAVVGLGVGTMNCFSKGKHPFVFIEIDPVVADVAQNHFSYLSDCNKQAPGKVIIGDGRLELLKLDKDSLDI